MKNKELVVRLQIIFYQNKAKFLKNLYLILLIACPEVVPLNSPSSQNHSGMWFVLSLSISDLISHSSISKLESRNALAQEERKGRKLSAQLAVTELRTPSGGNCRFS